MGMAVKGECKKKEISKTGDIRKEGIQIRNELRKGEFT